MPRLFSISKRVILIGVAIVFAVVNSGGAVLAADEEHRGDLNYYTHNGIIFYDGGRLKCSSTGSAVVGGAAGMLQKQKNLDSEWVPLLLNEAKRAGADPIAMASLLFWENRGFPKYGAPGGGSDSVGRGPWQITRGTWPASAGDYHKGVIDPLIATPVAANLVKSWGGIAGSPIGSIDQDFSKGKNIPSMATVAKNYNAGLYTWREPGVATHNAPGRTWLAPGKNWNNVNVGGTTKAAIIDDYIIAMTYAYYLIATGQSLPGKGELDNDAFVKKGIQNAQRIKDFKVTDNANTANECTPAAPGAASGNGNILSTAMGLGWPNQKYDNQDRKSAARSSYQTAMPKIQGQSTANSVIDNMTAWSDCGLFVSTTMRLSGADKKYQPRGTGIQLQYVKKQTSKYEVFDNLTNASQLKPGDIFIVNNGGIGHTFIYTGTYKGDDGKTYTAMSASWGSRVPMAGYVYFDDDRGHYTVARLRAANNAAATAGGQ